MSIYPDESCKWILAFLVGLLVVLVIEAACLILERDKEGL